MLEQKAITNGDARRAKRLKVESYLKMKRSYTKHLLEGLPIKGSDAVRLVLEAVEEMPELAEVAEGGKSELMQALRRVLRAGIEGVRAQEKTVCFSLAAEESLARRVAAGRRATTLRDLRHFIRRLLRVPGLSQRPLRAVGVAECREALEHAFAGSVHSFRKGRAVLHSIFAYGMRQGWCNSNPVAAVEVPPVEEKEIVPLTVEECHRLVEAAKTPRFRSCLPALGLMLFAGVRPGEVERLRWDDVHCAEGTLSIAARHSKTGGARRVELCLPLRRMLQRQCPSASSGQFPFLCPPRWRVLWQQLRQAAGLVTAQRRWVPDVLRHTYASYYVLTHRNLPALQLQLGHRDSRLLLTRYLNVCPLCRGDARRFWALAG